jgi:hypothetical protein
MGIVCCPTLMTQPCRYCDKVGHTVKFCQELIKETEKTQKMERKRKASEAFNTAKPTPKSEKTNTKKANKWAALDDDSDEEEEDEEEQEGNKRVVVVPVKKTWAAIASQPENFNQKNSIFVSKSIIPTAIAPKAIAIGSVNPFSTFVNSDSRPKVFASSLSWADIMDSDEEGEEY